MLGLSAVDVDKLVTESLGMQQLTNAAAESARQLNYAQFKESLARLAMQLCARPLYTCPEDACSACIAHVRPWREQGREMLPFYTLEIGLPERDQGSSKAWAWCCLHAGTER